MTNGYMSNIDQPDTHHAYAAGDGADPPVEPQSGEVPQQDDEATPPLTGVLQRLQETRRLYVERTTQRLHRNLGHPTNKELHRLLQDHGASQELLQAAEHLSCELCNLHRPPAQVPKSNIKHDVEFNKRLIVDTVWIHLLDRQNPQIRAIPKPVLSMVDAGTKLMGGRLLYREQSYDMLRAIERVWIANFGPRAILQVDDHRGWSSEEVRSWASDNGILLEIAPGQTHTRLSLIERRHQVLRRAIEIFAEESSLAEHSGSEKIIHALCYVIPEINARPNIGGYSPIQLTLGYQPRVPGLLSDEDLTVAQLSPSETLATKLHLKTQAMIAVTKADNDARLRRALLRQHVEQRCLFFTGQRVFYWRDGPGGAGPKLRWKGPATVALVEEGQSGPITNVYWIVHGTTLLRASAEHLQPTLDYVPDDDLSQMDRARQALDGVRGRSTTLYIDLLKSNKRKRAEVATEDEEMEPPDI